MAVRERVAALHRITNQQTLASTTSNSLIISGESCEPPGILLAFRPHDHIRPAGSTVTPPVSPAA
jgi:hypothetical protein